ncbi:IS110 family transposase [Gordonia sp. NPDC003424]
MTEDRRAVIGGVDTHSATHHAAVIDAVTGVYLADAQFPATTAGYRQLGEFLAAHGQVVRVGVEGTNSYGAGLTRHLRAVGITVREVIRPKREQRRRGKSDPLDAIAAARNALAHNDLPEPKVGDGAIEVIRVLSIVRKSAIKARTATIQQIKSILVTAPAQLREQLAGLTDGQLFTVLRTPTQTDTSSCQVTTATTRALRSLANRYHHLTDEINTTTTELESLTEQQAPAMVHALGIGAITAAQLLVTAGDNPERLRTEAAFAALCGVSPIPASSGKTNRHRLNRGGDRAANCAIHQIALVRMGCDDRTQAYIAKKTTEGKSTLEAMRCLKRAIAREVFGLLTNPPAVPTIDDLRPARKSRGWSLQHVADHFGVWPARISEIERGKRRDNVSLINAYRELLAA